MGRHQHDFGRIGGRRARQRLKTTANSLRSAAGWPPLGDSAAESMESSLPDAGSMACLYTAQIHFCIEPFFMAQPHIVRFQSIAALRSAAEDWNDLWQRTAGALPTGRAELIADWLEQFAPQAKFVALAVEQDGQLVAGLPLVQRRVLRFSKAGSLPSNSHCWAGQLLVDQSADVRVLWQRCCRKSVGCHGRCCGSI